MVSKILTWLKSFINNKEKYVIVFIDSTKTTTDENSVSSVRMFVNTLRNFMLE